VRGRDCKFAAGAPPPAARNSCGVDGAIERRPRTFCAEPIGSSAAVPPRLPPPLTPVELRRERLDADGVIAHFASIAGRAQAVEIRTKGAAAALSEAASGGLDDAARRLIAGEIVAVQLRFFEDNAWWCDTVVRKGRDFRLVRMREESPPEG
jgi:hypothetical protein